MTNRGNEVLSDSLRALDGMRCIGHLGQLWLDGNKRTSLAVTDVFLGLNGFLIVEPLGAHNFIVGFITKGGISLRHESSLDLGPD